MPFYRLAIPFVLLLLGSIYLTYAVDSDWAISIVILVVILLGGFILSPLINWWWWERFPPDLAPELGKLLEAKFSFYQKLDDKGKREFRKRIFMFSQGTNFMAQGIEKVSEDMKLMIASAPVTMSFHDEAFLFDQFENIVVYPHPFPSPQYPEQFHASEIYQPDGVVMLCVEHVIRGFIENDQYFSPAWYEYAKIYQLTYPDKNYGDWSNVDWKDIEKIGGFTKESLIQYIGLPNLDIKAFGIACYFLYPDAFRQQLPKNATVLDMIFK